MSSRASFEKDAHSLVARRGLRDRVPQAARTWRTSGPQVGTFQSEGSDNIGAVTRSAAQPTSLVNTLGESRQALESYRAPPYSSPTPPSGKQQPSTGHYGETTQIDGNIDDDEDPEGDTSMIRLLESREISREQLVSEVKGVYAGLVMVESKCIEVDNAQGTPGKESMTNQQWQAMTALHRTLLQEHHDFFLASQHPAGSPALRNLAPKYAMAARMWRHGIHSFLEILRQRLPESMDHMLNFLYHTYGLVGVFLETVPAFKETWIECLGDLARYRMVVEGEDRRDHELWSTTAAGWYAKAAEFRPFVGRLYHHLAILSRQNLVQQLAYYLKSLCVSEPFPASRDSIKTLLDPALDRTEEPLSSDPPADPPLLEVVAIIFSGAPQHRSKLPALMKALLKAQEEQLSSVTDQRFRVTAYAIGLVISFAPMGFGHPTDALHQELRRYHGAAPIDQDQPMSGMDGVLNVDEADRAVTLKAAIALHHGMSKVFFDHAALDLQGDYFALDNLLPFFVVQLSHLVSVFPVVEAVNRLARGFPWVVVARALNNFSVICQERWKELGTDAVTENGFTTDKDGKPYVLPEDWIVRGSLWAQKNLFPQSWFPEDVDFLDKTFESENLTVVRLARILAFGQELALKSKYLSYDSASGTYSASLPTAGAT